MCNYHSFGQKKKQAPQGSRERAFSDVGVANGVVKNAHCGAGVGVGVEAHSPRRVQVAIHQRLVPTAIRGPKQLAQVRAGLRDAFGAGAADAASFCQAICAGRGSSIMLLGSANAADQSPCR